MAIQLEKYPYLYNDPSLKALYPLDDTTDIKGGNNLTNIGSASFAAGKFGNCVDGGTANTTKYLYSPTAPLTFAEIGTAWTVNFWVKANITLTGTNQYFAGIVNTSGGKDKTIQLFYHATTNTIRHYMNLTGSVSFIDSGLNPTSGTWYMITLTYDGTNLYSYYNGTNKVTTACASGTGNAAANSGIIIMGYPAWGASCAAAIDDLAVFNRKLTDQEILDFYNQSVYLTYKFRPGSLGSLL